MCGCSSHIYLTRVHRVFKTWSRCSCSKSLRSRPSVWLMWISPALTVPQAHLPLLVGLFSQAPSPMTSSEHAEDRTLPKHLNDSFLEYMVPVARKRSCLLNYPLITDHSAMWSVIPTLNGSLFGVFMAIHTVSTLVTSAKITCQLDEKLLC